VCFVISLTDADKPHVQQEISMSDEIIDLGESAPTPPDADFWLEYGRKMVTESATTLRSAATALMTGLGALQGIYLGILGFAKFIPDDTNVGMKLVYVSPLLFWMVALYLCLRVMMTEVIKENLHVWRELEKHHTKWVEKKQLLLELAFWWSCCGMLGAIGLVVLRGRM
jgi:hypothetical protein